MTQRDTTIRSMHDLGLAAWFGGALMGAVGLNGGAAEAKEPAERTRLSSLGWKRWSPVLAGAIGVHAIGGAGLILSNRNRVQAHGGAGGNTAVKFGLTLIAAGVTAYSGVLGSQVEKNSHEGAEGATEPAAGSSDELAKAQRQLKITQWVIPALTGVLIVMGAQQGEQQKPAQQLLGRLKSS